MGCGRLTSHLQTLLTAAQCAGDFSRFDFVFCMNTKSVIEKYIFHGFLLRLLIFKGILLVIICGPCTN